MGNRTLIWFFGCIAALVAVWNGSGTAAVVIMVGTTVLASIHALEVKINKLLDDRGIFVSQDNLKD
jgi:hypothetical protein